MVNPVTGPFSMVVGAGTTSQWSRTWYRQKRPYNLPLPFQFSTANTVGIGGAVPPAASAVNQIWINTPASDSAVAACRNKLNSKLGEASMWMVNILEREKTVSMLAGYLTKLRRGYRAVRKGRFKEANRLLGFPKGKVSRDKQFADNLLAYKFGIKPLFQDIFAAVETLQNPLPNRTVSSSGRGIRTAGENIFPPRNGTSSDWEMWEYSVRSGFKIEISNPDLFLANQLGLVNPATVVWETIPFSFLIDWLIPVGDFLNSMTATLGLTLSQGWTTVAVKYYRRYMSRDFLAKVTGFSGNSFYVRRQAGALSPGVTLSASNPFSISRAQTAWALLTQQLRR